MQRLNIADEMEPNLTQRCNLIWNVSTIAAGGLGILASFTEKPLVASAAIIFCAVSAYQVLADRFGSIITSSAFLLAPFIAGICFFLVGNVVTPLPRFSIVLISFCGLIFVCLLFGGSKHRTLKKELFASTSTVFLGFLISLVSTSKIISFIAFGYDNFYHLAIFRSISKQRILLVGGGCGWLDESREFRPAWCRCSACFHC